MGINTIINAVGTLFPIIFPKQEFKPNRLAAVLICIVLAIGSVKLLGLDDTIQAIEVAEEIIELTEE